MSKQKQGDSTKSKRTKKKVSYLDRPITAEQIIVNLILYVLIFLLVFIIAALGLIGGIR